MLLSRSSSSSIGGMMLRSRSEENLNKLNDCMENMDDDVSKLFMEFHQTDFREDPELFRLLNDYFATSKGVSKLCESLRKFLEKAEHDECVLIDESLLDFEEEKNGYGGLLEASFRKTFQDLRNFTDGDYDCDFFSGDFLRKTQICHEDLVKMIVKLETTMKDVTSLTQKTVERSIRVTADFAVKKRSSVAVAMGGMEKEGKRLKSMLVDLNDETEKCDGFLKFGRTVAREKIVEFLSHGEKRSI